VVGITVGAGGVGRYWLAGRIARFEAGVAAVGEALGPDYDLIYSHYWLSGLAARPLAEGMGVPWVHTAHTLALVKNRQLAEGALAEPQLRIGAERSIARHADLLIASTDAEREDLVRAYGADPARVKVVAPGVDLHTFHPLPRADARRRLGFGPDPIVLFVGRLERLKGADIVLRAAARASRRHPRLRVLVVGADGHDTEGSEAARLQTVARELGIDERVNFVGAVPHASLRRYYAAADVCLMPSYSESFGLVGLEAQACGCPVIAANVAGLASVVRDGVTGYLVDSDEPDDYADRLEMLLDAPILAEQMGRRAIVLAQRFSWSRTAERLLDEFQALVRAAQPRVQAGARQE
jgi:D-inositol-3-phosphate glycosyltransferase